MVKLVGILNLTPDSFTDGAAYNSDQASVEQANQLFRDGAAFIDLGAESTRPGAVALCWQEEVDRLAYFVDWVGGQSKISFSLDTYHPETVRWVQGRISKFIVNDVTGFRDPNMRDVAAELGLPVIASHLPASSAGIQEAHKEKLINSVDQVVDELGMRVEQMIAAGIAKQKIILDPGIGFGKTPEANWALLEFASFMPDHEVMIGYSRKKFLGENCKNIEPNLLAGKIAVASGAAYMRVHDVRGHASLQD